MRNLDSRLVTIAMVLALITTVVGTPMPTSAQPSSASQSVIAHGVDDFNGSTMMWQVSQKDAGNDQDAAPTETSTGFVYASGGSLTIADSTAGQGDYLREGAASFHPRGARQRVVANSDTTYTDIALGSDDLGGAYTSNGIQTPNGTRALDLFTFTLPNGAGDSYAPDNEFGYLLHVTSGSITFVDDENTSYDRRAGESITITGAIEITATSDATFLIASIGPEVTIPSFANGETGTLTVKQFDCPSGIDPTVDSSTCTPVVEPWFVNIHPSGRDDDSADLNIPDDGVNENGSWTWTEMSIGTWYITPAATESDSFQVIVTGATAEDDHYSAEIAADQEAVVNIYLAGEQPTGNGWLDIARTTCDVPLAELTALEMQNCARNTENAPEFSLIRVNDESVRFDESSAQLTNDGYFRVSDIPAGVYVISFDVPEQGDLRISGDVTNAGGVLRYTVFITPEGGTIVIFAESPVTTQPEPGATPQG